MAKANDLKALQIKQKDLDSQKLLLLRKMAEVQEELNKTNKKYDVITKQIEHLTKDFTVTEHALLRYCEKTYSINLNEVSKKEQQMATAQNSIKESAFDSKQIFLEAIILFFNSVF